MSKVSVQLPVFWQGSLAQSNGISHESPAKATPLQSQVKSSKVGESTQAPELSHGEEEHGSNISQFSPVWVDSHSQVYPKKSESLMHDTKFEQGLNKLWHGICSSQSVPVYPD